MSESNGIVDSLFLTICVGNVFLIFFAASFGALNFDIFLSCCGIFSFPEFPDFSNFGFNLATIANLGTATALSIQFIFTTIAGFASILTIPIQVYAQLGLFGILVGGITGCIVTLFIFNHIRGISEAVTNIVNAIGNLIPGT